MFGRKPSPQPAIRFLCEPRDHGVIAPPFPAKDYLPGWFRRLLQDIKANRTGMPDLIQFYPAQRSYRMIEVKGPGDRLQDNQLRWLDFCAEPGMPVMVSYVQWAEDSVLAG